MQLLFPLFSSVQGWSFFSAFEAVMLDKALSSVVFSFWSLDCSSLMVSVSFISCWTLNSKRWILFSFSSTKDWSRLKCNAREMHKTSCQNA